MALINVKKKIEKNADKLGIAEPVQAACTTNPSGTMQRMLAKELGGVIASAVASGEATNPDEGMAASFPSGQHMLVLTEERLLLTDVSAMLGAPKKIVAEWPRSDIAALVVEDGKMSHPITIAFSDGTAVQVEGAKGTDPAAIGTAFAA